MIAGPGGRRGRWWGGAGQAVARQLSRRANDIAAEVVRRCPARLRAFATLPMADPEAATAELERAAGLGFVEAMVYGRTGPAPLDDPRYDEPEGVGPHPLQVPDRVPDRSGARTVRRRQCPRLVRHRMTTRRADFLPLAQPGPPAATEHSAV
ncbi:amidohydrolase [Actinoplanes sp. N902-109]|nr:amidohydrolase [Actinoplanes sp. N902-109]